MEAHQGQNILNVLPRGGIIAICREVNKVTFQNNNTINFYVSQFSAGHFVLDMATRVQNYPHI